jgi:hypothetical protein
MSEKLLKGTVLFLLPFFGVIIVAGTVATLVTPIVVAGTVATWSTVLRGAKECL